MKHSVRAQGEVELEDSTIKLGATHMTKFGAWTLTNRLKSMIS